jgi:hypothetical protein
MAGYLKTTIDICIDTESELYRRICAAAEKSGESVKYITELTASAGLYYHMGDNLKCYYERENA